MSTSWVPPRPLFHLRVFAVSLAVIVLALVGFLFGVQMEAVAPATGVITSRQLHEVRAPRAGLIEPGWYEGEVARTGGPPLHARCDGQGEGTTRIGLGKTEGAHVPRESLRFHRLQPGDELWPGQVVASVCGTDGRFQPESVLRVPSSGDLWLVVQVRVAPLQAVQAGDLLATLVPIDPETHQPADLIARLDLAEKHAGDVAAGQHVRLYSTMHNHRLHGNAEARVERLEPAADVGDDGQRRFIALAPVTHAPFSLPLGSTFKAEVVLGRKPVYRIILEQ